MTKADISAAFELLKYEQSGSVISMIIRCGEDGIRSGMSGFAPKLLDIIPMTLEEIFICETEGMGYDSNSII